MHAWIVFDKNCAIFQMWHLLMLPFTNDCNGENDKFSYKMTETAKVQVFGICGSRTWCFFQNKLVPPLWGSGIFPLLCGCCSKIDVGWDFRFFQSQSWSIYHSLYDLCSAPEQMHQHSFAYLDKKTGNYSTFWRMRTGWKHFLPSVLFSLLNSF